MKKDIRNKNGSITKFIAKIYPEMVKSSKEEV